MTTDAMPTVFRLQEILDAMTTPPSMNELERRAGLDVKTIRAIRNNTAKRVDLATLDKLAQALDCEPGDLIGRQTGRKGRAG